MDVCFPARSNRAGKHLANLPCSICSTTPMLADRSRIASASAAAIMLAFGSIVLAHEGHAPLPTKGAEVDVDKGLATLSADARDALGVETAEVVEGQAPERVMAYARV